MFSPIASASSRARTLTQRSVSSASTTRASAACALTLHTGWPRTKLVLHSTAPTEDYLPLMANKKFLRNIIAKNDEPLEPDELIVTAEKLLRQDLFGLQKYLLWGIEPYCVTIRDSRLKQDYIHEVEKAVQNQMKGAFQNYKALKAKYKDETTATREFIRAKSPKNFQGLIESVDAWVASQVGKAEKKVAEKLGDDETQA